MGLLFHHVLYGGLKVYMILIFAVALIWISHFSIIKLLSVNIFVSNVNVTLYFMQIYFSAKFSQIVNDIFTNTIVIFLAPIYNFLWVRVFFSDIMFYICFLFKTSTCVKHLIYLILLEIIDNMLLMRAKLSNVCHMMGYVVTRMLLQYKKRQVT